MKREIVLAIGSGMGKITASEEILQRLEGSEGKKRRKWFKKHKNITPRFPDPVNGHLPAILSTREVHPVQVRSGG